MYIHNGYFVHSWYSHTIVRARSRNTDELKAPDNVIIIIIIIVIVNKSNTTILIMKTKYLFL